MCVCVCVLNGNMHVTKGSRAMTHDARPVSTLSIRVLDVDAIT